MTECGVQECSRRKHAHGYCAMHAARLRRNGDPTRITRTTTLDSFWRRVHKTEKCWNWQGFVLDSGYGQIATRKKPTASGTRLAHRVAYELVVGPIPEGLDLDHLCRNRICVNPSHLEPVTDKENVRRGLHGVLRTHCKYNHELTPENTRHDRDGGRRCRTCAKRWNVTAKAKKRAQKAKVAA